MFRKTLCLLTSAFAISYITVGEELNNDDDSWSFSTQNSKITITGCSKTSDSVIVIPAVLNGCPVTGIAPAAFNICSNVVEFQVESGNNYFRARNGALYSADGKTLIKVPQQLVCYPFSIEKNTEDVAVTTTAVPRANQEVSNNVTVVETVVGEGKVSISDILRGVTTIGPYAFAGCGRLAANATFAGTIVSTTSTRTFTRSTINGKTTTTPGGDVTSTTSSLLSGDAVKLPIAMETFTAIPTNTLTTSITESDLYQVNSTKFTSHMESGKFTASISIPSSISVDGTAFVDTEITRQSVTAAALSQVRSSAMITPVGMDSTNGEIGKATYDSWLTDNAGRIVGVATIKTTKPHPKTKVVKVTATITLLGKNKLTLKDSTIANSGSFSGPLAGMSLSGNKVSGALNGYTILGIASSNESFSSFNGKAYTVAIDLDDYEIAPALARGTSALSIAFKTKGKAKISGFLGDGTKVNGSSQLVALGEFYALPVCVQLYTGKKGGFGFLALFDSNGKFTSIADLSSWHLSGKSSNVQLPWHVSDFGSLSAAGDVSKGVLDPNLAGLSNYGLYEGKVSGWNPRLTKGTGVFKGFFYVQENGSSSKVKANVNGVMVNGVGYGSALIKKVASCPITVK